MVKRLVEDPFARLTGSRLQPVDLAKRLQRAMEASRTISVGRVYAANVYAIALSPTDYAAFEPFLASLRVELSDHVSRRGGERGYTFVGPIDVAFSESSQVRAGDATVAASIRDMPTPTRITDIKSTRVFTRLPDEPFEVGDVRQAKATLTVRDEDGLVRSVPLGRSTVRLGRGLDNDVVLESASVSRNHAEVFVQSPGTFGVRDIGSTNGTLLNGKRIRESALRKGDVFTMGVVTIRFDSAE